LRQSNMNRTGDSRERIERDRKTGGMRNISCHFFA
jgi:hypothetical protein